MVRIYRKHEYNIYSYGREYIIHNTNKPFEDGHTHVNNFKTAKMLIDLCIHKQLPNHLYEKFLVSLSRITNNNRYRCTLLDAIQKIKIYKKM